jgi:sodium-coupled neutral amino acid transporter 11
MSHAFANEMQPQFHRRALATERHSHNSAAGETVDLLPDGNGGGDIEKAKSSAGGSVGGGSSVAAATFGLVKAMVGSGVLALPAGLAAVSDFPAALLPANVLLIALGVLSAYTFSLYGRLTDQTQAKSLGDLWKKVMKTDQSIIISTFSFIYCFGVLLTFGLVIGDLMSSLATAGGLTGWMAARQTSILAVTAGILYPLCNLPSLASLAPVSIVGVLGTLFTTLFMALRCPAVVTVSPYSATAEPASLYLQSIPDTMQPSFSTYTKTQSPAPLIIMAMACTTFLAHFSVPDFYHSLADPTAATKSGNHKSVDKGDNDSGSDSGSDSASDSATDSASDNGVVETNQKASPTIKKFTKMTVFSFVAATLINTLTMTFGFLTFGGNSAGIVLNNYSALDVGASVSRLTVAVSVIGGYPFLIKACRSEVLELLTQKEVTRSLERKTTTILLCILTFLCVGVLEDAGFVVSLNGALMGSNLIYTFPALLFLKQTDTDRVPTRSVQLERAFCWFLVGFGAVSSLVGAATCVMNSYFPHLLL